MEVDDVDTIFLLSEDVPTNDNVDIDNSTMIANVDASCTLASSGNTWNGFKMIEDNINKNLHPSFQGIDSTTRSLHYFHSYALLDRVDFSGQSDEPQSGNVEFNTLLPSSDDIKKLKDYLVILTSRYL